MTTTLTNKGQVTIPKKIREALRLTPGCAVDFRVERDGEVVLRRSRPREVAAEDRFEAARGRAQVRWTTDRLMELLRGED